LPEARVGRPNIPNSLSTPPFTACLRTFEAEFDFVYRALRRHGVNEIDAEDLTQDVFLVMWRRWDEYDSDRPLRPWLAGIAFKVAHEFHKRSWRVVPRGTLDRRDERPQAEEQVASASARALVMRALGNIPDKYRSVIVMHDLDGVSMHDIAADLAVPLFTAYSRLRLAREAFAKAVQRMATPAEVAITPTGLLEIEGSAIAPAPAGVRRRSLSRARALMPLPLAASASGGATLEGAAAGTAAGSAAAVVAMRTVGRHGFPLAAGAGLVTTAAALATLVLLRGPAGSDERQAALTPGPLATAAAVPRPFATASALALEPQAGPAAASAARLAAASVAAPAAPALALGKGLIGYWRFDDGPGSAAARDLSGNGNHCVLRQVDPGKSWVAGAIGTGVALDGHGWLECPRIEAVARLGTELSIGMWARRSGRPTPQRHVLFGRQLGTWGEDHFALALRGNQVEVMSHVWRSTMRKPMPPTGDRWFHLAMVHADDGSTHLYIDGLHIGKSTWSRRVHLGGGDNPLTIGGGINTPEPGDVGELFEGAVDELVVYDRALTGDEVAALAGRKQPPIPPAATVTATAP
jgi:RNA polymerase sigma-70 factor, ECF subfamily